ncbi:acyl carrier protein [Gordonia sp. TBRC 11910]|uniref:Acyl carrier protein n=1 Tax=Gordonia asplenii TaxID=2725283 RepID=A0A848KTK8_9ACTN|nr:phosphopantetheine-binding protein [Gordonia asplenii]NMN99842.1 acyl carrier protein [Gordonia asplenii]
MSVEQMVQIFRRVLGTKDVDERSDFFDLGGDSLLATRVLSAIARECGTELSYEDFVDDPSARGLVARMVAVVS